LTEIASWTPEEQDLLASLDAPWKVQEYLDTLPYTLDDQTAHPAV